MNIANGLRETPVSSLDLSRFVSVDPSKTTAETVTEMNNAGVSCACVADGPHLRGVFTQRDILLRIIGRSFTWDRPISEEMTKTVRTMGLDESVFAGLTIMNDWWVRSVPVIDRDDRLAGCLSYYTIMKEIAVLVGDHLRDASEAPELQHGLGFVDFTGLPLSPPVSVRPEDAVEVAAHHMKARGIGSVLVTDDRDHLVGMLTEYDLQYKVGCSISDLESLSVKEIMTSDPIAIEVRSPISDAIQQMAEEGFSHIPLLGESGRPVGAASFRDIASYLESSIAALG